MSQTHSSQPDSTTTAQSTGLTSSVPFWLSVAVILTAVMLCVGMKGFRVYLAFKDKEYREEDLRLRREELSHVQTCTAFRLQTIMSRYSLESKYDFKLRKIAGEVLAQTELGEKAKEDTHRMEEELGSKLQNLELRLLTLEQSWR